MFLRINNFMASVINFDDSISEDMNKNKLNDYRNKIQNILNYNSSLTLIHI